MTAPPGPRFLGLDPIILLPPLPALLSGCGAR